jgi:integrase
MVVEEQNSDANSWCGLRFVGPPLVTIPHHAGRTVAVAMLSHNACDAGLRIAEALIFSTRSGRPCREAQIGYRVLRPAAERAGIGRVTNCATSTRRCCMICRRRPKVIQRQLGHERVVTTPNLYTHAISGTHRLA